MRNVTTTGPPSGRVHLLRSNVSLVLVSVVCVTSFPFPSTFQDRRSTVPRVGSGGTWGERAAVEPTTPDHVRGERFETPRPKERKERFIGSFTYQNRFKSSAHFSQKPSTLSKDPYSIDPRLDHKFGPDELSFRCRKGTGLYWV